MRKYVQNEDMKYINKIDELTFGTEFIYRVYIYIYIYISYRTVWS